MGKKCCVPNCTSGYATNPVKATHFSTRDKALQEQWTKAIPRKDFTVTDKTYVCHRHFEEDDIVKGKWMDINGKKEFFPNVQWSLRPGAIPRLFPDCPKYLSQPSAQKRKPPSRNLETVSNKRRRSQATPVIANEDVAPQNETEIEQQTTHMELSGEGSHWDSDIAPFHSWVDELESGVLPSSWTVWKKDLDNLFIGKLNAREDQRGLVIERSVAIDRSGVLFFYARCKLQNNAALPHSASSSAELIEAVEAFDKIPFCNGIVDKEFRNVKSCLTGKRENDTWISENCEVLVYGDEGRNFCDNCKHLQQSLRCKLWRIAQNLSGTSPSVENKRKLAQRNMQQRVRRQAKKLQELKDELNKVRHATKVSDRDALEKYLETLDDQVRLVVRTILKEAACSDKRGMRYDAEWLIRCLILRIKSPKAYEHLRDTGILPLPHRSTIQRLISAVPCKFGFNDSAISAIERSISQLSKSHRHGSIVWDEMAISKQVAFNSKTLQFDGYVDYGEVFPEIDDEKLADHVLVFIFRPYRQSWVQPIGIFASSGAAPANVILQLLIKATLAIEKQGARVLNAVSDGCQTNKSLFKMCGLTGKKKEVKHFIEHPADFNAKLFFLFDVPHLFKCIRNHIMKHCKVQCRGREVRFDYFKTLFQTDQNYPLRRCPRLTKGHLNPNNWQKMTVKLATQLLSHSVATGIAYYRDEIGADGFAGSEATEDLVRLLDSSFDVLNGRFMKEGINKNNWPERKRVLCDLVEALDASEMPDIQLEPFASKTTIEALRMTIASVADITEMLLYEHEYSFVLTGKFNQDCIERFFGLIRGGAGSNDHPNVTSVLQLFRLLSHHNPAKEVIRHGNVDVKEKMEILSSYTSCLLDKFRKEKKDTAALKKDLKEKIFASFSFCNSEGSDGSDHLQSAGEIVSNDIMCSSTSTLFSATDYHIPRYPTEEELEISNTILDSKKAETSRETVKKHTVYYLCGYLLYSRFQSISKCDRCLRALCTTPDCLPSQFNEDAFTAMKDKGGLKYCTPQMYNTFIQVENVVEEVLDIDSLHIRDLFHSIVEKLDGTVIENFDCLDHRDTVLPSLIFDYLIMRCHFETKKCTAAETAKTKTKALRKKSKVL